MLARPRQTDMCTAAISSVRILKRLARDPLARTPSGIDRSFLQLLPRTLRHATLRHTRASYPSSRPCVIPLRHTLRHTLVYSLWVTRCGRHPRSAHGHMSFSFDEIYNIT